MSLVLTSQDPMPTLAVVSFTPAVLRAQDPAAVAEHVPDIIKAAATSTLGILALMIIVVGILGYVFFKDASQNVRAGMYVLMLVGVAAFVGIGVDRSGGTPDPTGEPGGRDSNSGSFGEVPPTESGGSQDGPPMKGSRKDPPESTPRGDAPETPVQSPVQSPIQSSVPAPAKPTFPVRVENTSRYVGGQSWDWTIFIDADQDALSEIRCVEYTLHPTFSNPVQQVCTPSNHFAFSTRGWGEFEIRVRVLFKDGSEKQLIHMLQLR